MKFKKIAAMMLAAAMTCTLLAGCGGSGGNQADSASAPGTETVSYTHLIRLLRLRFP